MVTSEEEFLELVNNNFDTEDDVKYFTNPTYWQACIGIVPGRFVVYSRNKIEQLLVEEGMDIVEAVEFVDFNCNIAGEGYPLLVEELE